VHIVKASGSRQLDDLVGRRLPRLQAGSRGNAGRWGAQQEAGARSTLVCLSCSWLHCQGMLQRLRQHTPCAHPLTALRQGPQLQQVMQPSPQEPRQRGHSHLPLASACRMSSPCRFFRHSLLQQGRRQGRAGGCQWQGRSGIDSGRAGEREGEQAHRPSAAATGQPCSATTLPCSNNTPTPLLHHSLPAPLTRRRLPGGAPPRSWGGCR
jgi:hypothetical protein